MRSSAETADRALAYPAGEVYDAADPTVNGTSLRRGGEGA